MAAFCVLISHDQKKIYKRNFNSYCVEYIQNYLFLCYNCYAILKKHKRCEQQMRALQTNRDVRVLICDDNPVQRASMVECLSEQMGLQVVCAVADGLEALRSITELQPDVVVCDLVMTHLDGFGLLERMAKLVNPPQTIVLTALKRDDFILRALELGAAYYMVKPVESDILTQRILSAARRQTPSQGTSVREDVSLRSSGTLEERISALLLQLRIPAHLSGYRFIRQAILLALAEPALLDCVTYALYPAVAARYETSASCVERAIRHAITVAWNRGGPSLFSGIMCCHLENGDKPTNRELLTRLVEALRYRYLP